MKFICLGCGGYKSDVRGSASNAGLSIDRRLDGLPEAAAARAAFFRGGGAATSVSSPLASRFLRLSLLFRLDRCSPVVVGTLGAGEALAACASAMVGTLGAGELIPDEAAEEPMPCWVDAIAGEYVGVDRRGRE